MRLVWLVLGLLVAACGDSGSAADPRRTPAPFVPGERDAEAAPSPAPIAIAPLARVAPPYDPASTASQLAEWPRIVPGVQAHAFTSFDRSGGNDDGFGSTWSSLYTDALGEHVIMDTSGPGALRTLWFTSRVDGNGPLALGRVRFYFDGEAKPRLDVDADALYGGGSGAPFVLPLVQGNQVSSGGYASFASLPFAHRLRITTERVAGFYAAHYETFPPDWDVQSYTVGSQDLPLAARFTAASPSSLPLEEIALDSSYAGGGEIDVLRFEPSGSPTDDKIRSARISIWFDGEATPQIDVPLGAFFGSAIGSAAVSSVAWTMTPTLWESRLPMPFWEGYRILVSGLFGKLSIHRSAARYAPDQAGWLAASWTEARPTAPGRDFVYLDAFGAGKIVATVLGVEPLSPTAKQWWEGDLRTHVDASRTPSIHGTGHEDDHLGGWSNEFLERPFSLPMQGCPRTDVLDTDGQVNANATMYRVWPGIPFLARVRHSTEHGPQNLRAANYGAATFFYRQRRARLLLTDVLDVGSVDDVESHAYTAPAAGVVDVTSAFEGEDDSPLTGTVHVHESPVTFQVSIFEENAGVVLRRRFDRSATFQRAELVVDGTSVTTLLDAGRNVVRMWAERDVFVPARLTVGKARLSIAVVPDGPFRAARFEVFSVLR